MKKDVMLIAHFCDDFDGKGNNRFNYLAELFTNHDLEVELVTSNFSHNKKRKREDQYSQNVNYKVTFIEEPIYKKNVSLRRFYSHFIIAKNLKKYLKFRKKPNVIYCSVPSLDVAAVAATYAKKNNIKFIIDVQDLWPEAFKMVFNIPVVSNVVFYPMKRKAEYIYKTANEIIAVSTTYANRAIEINSKIHKGYTVFLGTDLNKFDEAFANNKYKKKHENELWLAYVGTLGHSYDLTSVFDALEIFKKNNTCDIKFIVMGDGPLKEKFEKYAKEKQINTTFTGRLPYSEMVGLLGVCNIAVNPISKGAAQSIINKHGDYAAAGLPVINTQECLEYRHLVDEYEMGLNCNNNDPTDLAEKLEILLKDNELRQKMADNSRRLAEEKFDRKNTYIEIFNLVNKI